MNLIRTYQGFWLFFCILLTSCAQIVAPTGGEEDVSPPEILWSEPENFSTNFNGRQFSVTFDEFFQLKDLKSQLVISPPLDELPEVKVKGKTLEVSWEDTLQGETTYIFNFGNAVTDITEYNAASNLLFVFSTGNYIDSLSMTGVVADAFLKTPKENMLVMLYQNTADSAPLLERPFYFTKTDEEGHFFLPYLKRGDYKIFALKDENFNYLYDLPNEYIAFESELVSAEKKDSNQNVLSLAGFSESNQELYLKDTDMSPPGQITLCFSKPIPSPKLLSISKEFPTEKIVTALLSNEDTLLAWLQPPFPELFELEISTNDSTIDTLRVFGEDFESKKGEIPVNLPIPEFSGGRNLELNQPLTFQFREPIVAYDTTCMTLFKDSIQIPFRAATDSNQRTFFIESQWEEGTSYTLEIDSNCFQGWSGQKNDSISHFFTVREKSYYGNIYLKVDLLTMQDPYILQLLTSSGQVVAERTLTQSATESFELLVPKTYKFRLIEDSNQNGKWDTGNYSEKRQPEKVIYYQESLEVRSNWDLDIQWNVQ